MYIEFERTGGFTGMPVRVTLDDRELTAEERAEVIRLIESSGFLSLETPEEPEHPMADQFSYRITVETTEYHHSIMLGEREIPDPVRPLIRFLSGMTRKRKKTKKKRRTRNTR